MKPLFRWLTAALLLLASATPALANFTLANYQKLKALGPLEIQTKLYLVGLGDGFVTANADLEARQLPKLYCQPAMPLNADNYTGILDKQVAKRAGTVAAYHSDWDIGTILLDALKEKFPCKE